MATLKIKGEHVSKKLYDAARELARQEFGPTGYEGTGQAIGYRKPPESRQCESKRSDGTGERCKNWSIPGSRFCRYHFGKKNCYVAQLLRAGQPESAEYTAANSPETSKMFYNKFLSKTLQDKMREALSVDQVELTSLLEDLAVMRITVGDVAELYDVTCLAYDAAEGEEAKMKALNGKLAAGQLLREAQTEVADLIDRIEKHRALQAQKSGVSVHALAYVAKQFTQIAYQLCGDDLDLARRLESEIRQIRLPETSVELQGTLITPDLDVLEMDATVPAAE